jgi:hypothetical protein
VNGNGPAVGSNPTNPTCGGVAIAAKTCMSMSM